VDVKLAEAEKVGNWVLEQFLRLGFTPEQAEDMSARGIDHHTAERMLAHGCSHELVIEILV
jgi:hypothetical protein